MAETWPILFLFRFDVELELMEMVMMIIVAKHLSHSDNYAPLKLP